MTDTKYAVNLWENSNRSFFSSPIGGQDYIAIDELEDKVSAIVDSMVSATWLQLSQYLWRIL